MYSLSPISHETVHEYFIGNVDYGNILLTEFKQNEMKEEKIHRNSK